SQATSKSLPPTSGARDNPTFCQSCSRTRSTAASFDFGFSILDFGLDERSPFVTPNSEARTDRAKIASRRGVLRIVLRQVHPLDFVLAPQRRSEERSIGKQRSKKLVRI